MALDYASLHPGYESTKTKNLCALCAFARKLDLKHLQWSVFGYIESSSYCQINFELLHLNEYHCSADECTLLFQLKSYRLQYFGTLWLLNKRDDSAVLDFIIAVCK